MFYESNPPSWGALCKFLFCFQEGWCDSIGSVEQIQAKIIKRQEAAAKRERAMAYALTHQVIIATERLI